MAEWNDIIATTQALLLVVIESGENEAACGRDARAEVAEAWAEEWAGRLRPPSELCHR